MYPPMCKISKNISTDAQDMQCSVQILAPSDAKSSSPSTPGQRGWSLAGGEIFIVWMQKRDVCLSFRFRFAREKVVNYCQNMFTVFLPTQTEEDWGWKCGENLLILFPPTQDLSRQQKWKMDFNLSNKSRIKQLDKMKFENVCKTYLPRCKQASSIHFYLICQLLSHISLHIFVMHWIVEAARLPPNSDPDAQTGLQVSRQWIKIGPQGGRIYIGFLEVINPSSGCLRGQILNLASKVDKT